jgi:hypothetical protein
VTEPEEYSDLKTKISRVRYVLDPGYHEALMVYTGWIEVPVASGPEKTKSYSINLSQVSDGPHLLVVSATAVCTKVPRYEVIVSDSDWVNFTFNTTRNTDSPSTAPQPNATPSPEPTPSPTPSTSLDSALPEFPSWIIFPSFITATLVAGIVYRRKRNR